MWKSKLSKPVAIITAITLFAGGLASLLDIGQTSAVSLTQTIVRLDRLAISNGTPVTTGGRVCIKNSTGATVSKVAVTFPTNSATDYALSSTVSNWAATGVADAALSASAWPNLSNTNPAVPSGHTVTWTMSGSSVMTASTLYCFQFAGGLTNAQNNTEVTPGTVQTQDGSGVPIDSGNFSIGLASPALVGDQIAITNAVVPPTFTFALNFNADAFQTNLKLNSWTATSATARTATVTTNAANGYIIWAKDFQNNGGKGSLKSATANAYITPTQAIGSAAHTYSVGAADYGLAASVTTNGSATATVNAAYVSTGGTTIGVLDPTTFEQVVAATTPTASDVVQLVEKASAAALTKAANDYADTITFVGAGLF